MRAADSPIFATMVSQLGQERADALARAAAADTLLAELESLHEPDADGECPACGSVSPCLTMLMLRRDLSLDEAFGVLREGAVIDLVRAERQGPPVPSLEQLLAAPTRGMDRFFDALLGLSPAADRDHGRRAS